MNFDILCELSDIIVEVCIVLNVDLVIAEKHSKDSKTYSGNYWKSVVKSSAILFTARRSYASAVLGVVILSVRLSVTCVHCD